MPNHLLPDEYLSGRLPEASAEVVRALIYARVSHEDSALSDLSIPQQIAACREECDRRGWEVVDVYEDAGKSAFTDSDEREGFRACVAAAIQSQTGREPIRRIVVDKLDRFSRDEHVNLLYKRNLLPQNGVQVYSVAERFDSAAGPSRTMERISEAMAIARSEEIARDTMRALVQNASTGHVCGGKAPWGYRAVKTSIGTDSRGNAKTRTNWVPDETATTDVARFFGLLVDGLGIHRVAQIMNEERRPSPCGGKWTRTTVYDLARKVYVYEGTYLWNTGHTVKWVDEDGVRRKTHRIKDPQTWIRTEGAYQALITPDAAEAVRRRFPLQSDSPEIYRRQAQQLANGQREPRKRGAYAPPGDGINNRSRGTEWLLTGIAVCKFCGAGLVSYAHGRKRKDGTFWRAYRCGAHHRSGGSVCRGYFIPADKIERLILQGVAERLTHRLAARDAQAYTEQVARRVRIEAQKRLVTLETEAAKRDVQIMEVVDAGIARGLDPAACNLRIQALRTEAADLRSKAQMLIEMIGHLESVAERAKEMLRSAGDMLLAWDALRPEERRERLRQLVTLIVIEKASSRGGANTAEIHFRAVLGSQEAHRKTLKAEITEMAENAPAGENKRPQADSDLKADVMYRCWLPDVDSNHEHTG